MYDIMAEILAERVGISKGTLSAIENVQQREEKVVEFCLKSLGLNGVM